MSLALELGGVEVAYFDTPIALADLVVLIERARACEHDEHAVAAGRLIDGERPFEGTPIDGAGMPQLDGDGVSVIHADGLVESLADLLAALDCLLLYGTTRPSQTFAPPHVYQGPCRGMLTPA